MAIFTALSLLLPATFGAGATIFGLSVKATAAIFQIGKGLLWSLAGQTLGPKAERQQIQAVINQSAAPRIRAYGRVMLGGVRALYEAEGGRLHQIVVAHHGPISAVIRFEIDGIAVELDSAGNVITAPWAGLVKIKSILSGDGGAYPEVLAAFPTIWTPAHRLAGQATFYVQMRAPQLSKLSQIFPKQAQTTVQMIADTSLVYDPRTNQTAFSDNASLCIRDYLTHIDGMRVPVGLIDEDSFSAFADICDRPIALKGGGVEPQWRVAGHYTLEDAPKDVVARLLAACDARLYMTPEGKVGILGGSWSEPEVVITADNILSLSLTDGQDDFTNFNVLKGLFTSPDHRFQSTECAEWRDGLALITEGEATETLEVEMCPSHSQMQRLMKIYRMGQRRKFTGSITTNLVGLKARFPKGDGIHTIRISDPETGIDGVFEVSSHSFSVADRTSDIGIATIENGYIWDAEAEEGPAPPPLSDLEKPSSVIPPPVISAVSQQVVVVTGDFNAVRLVVQVADPGRQGLQLEAEYQRDFLPIEWQPMGARAGELRAISGVVDDAEPYSLRARWAGQDTWSAISSITVAANPTAPDPATAFSRSIAGGAVTLSWVNGTAGYYKTRIYRGATNSFGAAALIKTVSGVSGQASSTPDAPGTGTWYYWAVTINASLIEAAPAGSISAII